EPIRTTSYGSSGRYNGEGAAEAAAEAEVEGLASPFPQDLRVGLFLLFVTCVGTLGVCTALGVALTVLLSAIATLTAASVYLVSCSSSASLEHRWQRRRGRSETPDAGGTVRRTRGNRLHDPPAWHQ
ncbi:unnamed protein product, partial [Pylaiella littoralis]